MDRFIADPEVQREIERVAMLLRQLSFGSVLRYSVIDTTTYALQKARARVEKEDGIRFGTVRAIGVKKLAADEVPAIGQSAIHRVHRTAKKTVARLGNLKAYNHMEPTDRLRVAAYRAIASEITDKSGRRTVKETEENIRTAGAAIDFGTAVPKRGQ